MRPFLKNIPRILPLGIDVEIRLFRLRQELGNVSVQEMFRTFNMGIGMIIICNAEDADEIALAANAKKIGKVASGDNLVSII